MQFLIYFLTQHKTTIQNILLRMYFYVFKQAQRSTISLLRLCKFFPVINFVIIFENKIYKKEKTRKFSLSFFFSLSLSLSYFQQFYFKLIIYQNVWVALPSPAPLNGASNCSMNVNFEISSVKLELFHIRLKILDTGISFW